MYLNWINNIIIQILKQPIYKTLQIIYKYIKINIIKFGIL